MGPEERRLRIAVPVVDAPHVAMAAVMLMADRPGLRVEVEGDIVVVAGAGCDVPWRSWWATALLNERLVSAAATRRETLLAELLA